MIGYTLVGSNDLERARAFYDSLFGAIGVGRLMDLPYSTLWGTSMEKPPFGVCRPHNGEAATAGNGTMISIALDTRAKIDALYAKAIELGATDEGAAGLRGEEGPMAFYGCYFRDLDGNKICGFRVGPA